MKSYSDNGESYGYYGYDASGERIYKLQLNTVSNNTNTYPNTKNLEVEKLMLYPNGYMNIDQDGNYTKHYYAGDQRIASKIGNEYTNIFIVVNADTSEMSIIKNELGKVIIPNDTIEKIYYPFGNITNLSGDTNSYENELYFYHGDHLSSTQMITDINAGIKQQVLYAPFGEVITEYNAYWNNDTIPRFLFNAKELDSESGMYYYSARYYNPPSFISRDPLFEKKPFMSPYAYCRNNPLIFIDPNGEDEYEFDKKGNLVNIIDNKNADILRVVKTDRKGNIKYDKNGNTKTIATSQNFEAGTITGAGGENIAGANATVLTLQQGSSDSRNGMFEFLAENTKVEWGTFSAFTPDQGEINKISTNHSNRFEASALRLIDEILFNPSFGSVSVINDYKHSHPNSVFQQTNAPSGYGVRGDGTPVGGGDKGVATHYSRRIMNMGVYDARDRIHYRINKDKFYPVK
jgi:RHS repeat-associated protein